MKASFLFGIISFVCIFMFETHFCWAEAAEYLMNDDEDDERQTIGEALSAAKDSPSFDVSSV